MRGQIVCDGGAVVSGIVDFVVSRRRSLRLLARVVERSSHAATALIVVNAVRCFAGVRCPPGSGALVAARRPNERRAVDDLRFVVPDVAWTPVAFEWRPAAMLAAFQTVSRPLSDLRRTARFARRLIRRHGVFRALRAVELVAYYRRYAQLLDRRRFALAVMSSHSNGGTPQMWYPVDDEPELLTIVDQLLRDELRFARTTDADGAWTGTTLIRRIEDLDLEEGETATVLSWSGAHDQTVAR